MPAPHLAPELGSPRACINSNYSSYFKLDGILTVLDALGLRGHKPVLSNAGVCSEPEPALGCVHPAALGAAHLRCSTAHTLQIALIPPVHAACCSTLYLLDSFIWVFYSFILCAWRLFAALFSIQGLELFWFEWNTSHYLTELSNATSPSALSVV